MDLGWASDLYWYLPSLSSGNHTNSQHIIDEVHCSYLCIDCDFWIAKEWLYTSLMALSGIYYQIDDHVESVFDSGVSQMRSGHTNKGYPCDIVKKTVQQKTVSHHM